MNEDTIAVEESLKEIEAHGQTINAALLEEVAVYVERHPNEFDMKVWSRVISQPKPKRFWIFTVPDPVPAYTVGCVACHTVRLGGGDTNGNTPAEAQRLLRLTDEQALRLFYTSHWPEPYRSEYKASKAEPTGLAWISAQRFRHFIKTDGAE